jgi:hypothetical protein
MPNDPRLTDERFMDWLASKGPLWWFNATSDQAAEFAWKEATRQALEECISIVERYEVSVGNSSAGEIACEMTMAGLRDIRAAILNLAKEE